MRPCPIAEIDMDLREIWVSWWLVRAGDGRGERSVAGMARASAGPLGTPKWRCKSARPSARGPRTGVERDKEARAQDGPQIGASEPISGEKFLGAFPQKH